MSPHKKKVFFDTHKRLYTNIRPRRSCSSGERLINHDDKTKILYMGETNIEFATYYDNFRIFELSYVFHEILPNFHRGGGTSWRFVGHGKIGTCARPSVISLPVTSKAYRVEEVESRKLLEPIDAIIDATMFGLALFDPGCKQSPVAGTCCFGACCYNRYIWKCPTEIW